MKKKLLLILFMTVACAAFILIGGAISGDPLTPKMADENKKIHIGVFEPLSGYLSDGGNQEALGLEYARSVRPTVSVKGVTYDIEFVYADNNSEAAAAESAAAYLVSEGVSAVLGSYGSSVSMAGGPVFSDAGIPAIGISCTNPQIASDFPLYFCISYNDEFQGKVLANFADSQGYRRAAVLTQAGDIYSKGLSGYFIDEFKRLGGEVLEYSFNSVQMNFEDLVAEIRTTRADCVFMPSASKSGAIFILQARKNGLFLPIIGADAWDSQTLISAIGNYGEDIYFSSPFSTEDPENVKGGGYSVGYGNWISRNEDRIALNGGSTYATPVAALAYDAYMMLCNAIEAADSQEPSAIAEQLKSASYTGVTGNISFDVLGEPRDRTAYIKTVSITEMKFNLLKTYLDNR